MPPPATPSALNHPELEALLAELYGDAATLKQTVAALREENARLKGLKGRPDIKPSGMISGDRRFTSRRHATRAGRVRE